MENSPEKPTRRYVRTNVKKIDEDTYQEKDGTMGNVINYQKTLKEFRFWLRGAEVRRAFEVNYIGFDDDKNQIEKSLNKSLHLKGKINDHKLDDIFVVENRSWSSEEDLDLYYDSPNVEVDKTLSLELTGCNDLKDRNVFYGGFSNKSALWFRIPSDFLEEIADNLAKYPDYSVAISFILTCFENPEGKILIECDSRVGDICISQIEMQKEIEVSKNIDDEPEKLGYKNKSPDEFNLAKIYNGPNLTNALWFVGGMMLANFFR